MSANESIVSDRVQELRNAGVEVVTEEDAVRAKSRDSWMRSLMLARSGQIPRAAALARPQSTEEVSTVLEWAQRTQTAVVPFGLGSGVCGAVLAGRDQVVLDMGRMDRLLTVDEHNLTATVEAGMRGSDFEQALADRGYTMGHWPQSIALSTVGGWAATRASGQFSTLYGNIEEMLLGCRVVLPGGRVITIPAVPRSSTGPDLRQVFMGSEGSLGVFTELTYRIHPAPQVRNAACFVLPDLDAGFEALRLIMRNGWRPAVTRLYDATEAGRNFAHVGEGNQPMLLLLSEGLSQRVEPEARALAEIVTGLGGENLGEEPVMSWLEHRNQVPTFESLLDQGVLADTIEVAIGWDRLGQLFDKVCAAGNAIETVIAMSGHVSHCYTQGANIYFTFVAVQSDLEKSVALYDEVWGNTLRITHEMGGTVAHHHGIGRVRRDWLRKELGQAHDVLVEIKRALDPASIMNPGALL